MRRGARSPRASNPASIESAELDARLLVGAVLGLDLTGLISAAEPAAHRGRIDSPGGFRPPPPRRRAGRAHSRRQGILGTAAAALGRNAGADGPTPKPWSNWRWKCCAHPLPRSSVAHRRSRHRLRRDSAGAAVGIAATRMGIGTDISGEALQTAHSNAARSRPRRSRRLHRLRLCGCAVGPVRSDRLEPALHPLGRYRRARGRGAESRSACRARRRPRRAGRLSRADSAGGAAAGAAGRHSSWKSGRASTTMSGS